MQHGGREEQCTTGAPAGEVPVDSLLPPGYVDVQLTGLGSFYTKPDGTFESIEYDGTAAGLEMHVPYDALEPYYVGEAVGLGLRCTRDITEGEHVVEFVGEVLDDLEVRARYDDSVPPKSAHYLMTIGDNAAVAMKIKRMDAGLGDSEIFVDQQTHGNKARFANDSEDAPNLRVCYWPEVASPEDMGEDGMLPRRAYLKAIKDIPVGTELRYSYGSHYDRFWKPKDVPKIATAMLRTLFRCEEESLTALGSTTWVDGGTKGKVPATEAEAMQAEIRRTVPEAPAFHPTLEEFGDPVGFITAHQAAAQAFGIFRIVPPKGWKPPRELPNRFPAQVQQVRSMATLKRRRKRPMEDGLEPASASTTDAPVRAFLIQRPAERVQRTWTTSEWRLLSSVYEEHVASSVALSGSVAKSLREMPLEGIFLRTYGCRDRAQVLIGSRLPGTEAPGSAPSLTPGAITRAPRSLLARLPAQTAGLTHSVTQMAMLFSCAPWTTCPGFLYSMYHHHEGSPVVWYAVPGTDAFTMESALVNRVFDRGMMPQMRLFSAPSLVSGQAFVDPVTLRALGVPCFRVVQHPGDIIIIMPAAYHARLHLGYAAMESVHFATPSWAPLGAMAARREHWLRLPMSFHICNLIMQSVSDGAFLRSLPPEDQHPILLAARYFALVELRWRRWVESRTDIRKFNGGMPPPVRPCDQCAVPCRLSSVECATPGCACHCLGCALRRRPRCSCAPHLPLAICRVPDSDLLRLADLVATLPSRGRPASALALPKCADPLLSEAAVRARRERAVGNRCPHAVTTDAGVQDNAWPTDLQKLRHEARTRSTIGDLLMEVETEVAVLSSKLCDVKRRFQDRGGNDAPLATAKQVNDATPTPEPRAAPSAPGPSARARIPLGLNTAPDAI